MKCFTQSLQYLQLMIKKMGTLLKRRREKFVGVLTIIYLFFKYFTLHNVNRMVVIFFYEIKENLIFLSCTIMNIQQRVVMLQYWMNNKIMNNGGRMKTYFSCFYQPYRFMRQSVILNALNVKQHKLMQTNALITFNSNFLFIWTSIEWFASKTLPEHSQ